MNYQKRALARECSFSRTFGAHRLDDRGGSNSLGIGGRLGGHPFRSSSTFPKEGLASQTFFLNFGVSHHETVEIFETFATFYSAIAQT